MTPDVVMAGNLLVDDVVLDDGAALLGQAGGALLHAALAGAAWGLRVGCVSVAGSDYPAEALATLRARGVALDGVRALATPGVRTWLLHEDGARRMICRLGRPSHADVSPAPGDVPAAWRGAGHLHLAPMPFERQRAMVEAFGDGGRFVSIDPHLPIRDDTLDAWRPVLARADALLASDDELPSGGSAGGPREALRSLAVGRLRYVVHKRGARGGALYDARADRLLRWEAVPAREVDPTGAGDAFAAGFLSALHAGLPVEAAVARGAATASVAVEGRGAEGIASCARSELDARSARCVVRAG